MKRIIIVICSLCAMIGICLHSALSLLDVKANVEYGLNEILIAGESGDQEIILKKVDELNEYWISKEGLLANYVRKNLVEDMGQSMAKLHPLAKYEDWASFYMEIASINWQMENMERSEAFTLANIF